jgi:hypothetical protein
MSIHWDDIELLRVLDQLEGEGRAYGMTGEDLLQAVAAGRPCTDQDRAAFVRLLHMLRDRGRLRFEQQNWLGAHQPQPHEHAYLQSLWHFELTETGKDRAIGRVVLEGVPDPDEDDGRPIPGLVLERFAGIIGGWYTRPQMDRFFTDAGLPPGPTVVPEPKTTQEAAYHRLAGLEQGGPEERRHLRRFLAAFLDGVLDAFPDGDQQTKLLADLAKAGWHPRGETLVAGERIRTPIAPMQDPESSAGQTAADGVDPVAPIFLVHHDKTRLHEVARFIERATNRDVVILHSGPIRDRRSLKSSRTMRRARLTPSSS